MKIVKFRKIMKIVLIVLAVVIVSLLIIYINHKIHTKKESELLFHIGQIVEVDGHNISVYIEGEGTTTLVYMSESGIYSPILDFKSLYSLLNDRYKIAVVEKFGYGFSDILY